MQPPESTQQQQQLRAVLRVLLLRTLLLLLLLLLLHALLLCCCCCSRAPQVSNARSIARYASPNMIQIGFYILSTPTLYGRGWGRQNVETELVKMQAKGFGCCGRIEWFWIEWLLPTHWMKS